ncbi:MAG: F0F1 ATP synthase subunit A [Candidatus Absconditabacterales bacterium]|nr:F0F1 ATP synthase subunit A [Candidatus Absconditabacterales bacterium]
MDAISFLPEYVDIIGPFAISQTLIASTIGTILFIIFSLTYFFFKKKNPHNKFVNLVDTGLEGIMDFFADLGEDLSYGVIKIVTFIFVYILWCNVFGLIGDLFVLVIPNSHSYFRPVSTDIFFNLTLAGIAVVASIIYGFKVHGFKYVEKYFGYRGLGLVPKVNSVGTFFGKIGDIILGLFMGIIETAGELSKMLSLSLRLFGNILAGMVLLGLIVMAANAIFTTPAILPLIVVLFELFVGFLQAFVFTMLVLVYFKIAQTH